MRVDFYIVHGFVILIHSRCILSVIGVFGFINKMRIQVVMEYTHETTSPFNWKELDFKCIPGSLSRRPCFLSPYHSRLDWETWIRVTAGFEHVVDRFDLTSKL